MGRSAFVNYEAGRWTVSLDGSSRSFGRQEEAVEEARARLRGQGGGTIYLGSGPDSKGDSIRVGGGEPPVARAEPQPRPAPRAPQPPPAPRPPQRPPVSPPAAVATKQPAEPEGIRAGVVALCESYRRASEEIEGFADPIEKDLGFGTLRLEAANTLRRLRGSLPTPAQQELQPLSEAVAALAGGTASETAVKGIDAAGRKVLRDVGQSLLALKLVGSASFLTGLLLAYADFSVELGGNFAKAVLLGGSAVIGLAKLITYGAPVAETAFRETTRWAEQLGNPTEAAMAKPRQAEKALLDSFAVVPPSNYKPLAARAGLRAELVVIGFWIGVCFGAFNFLVGVWGVVSQLG